MRQRRNREIKSRKNFLPSLLVTVFLFILIVLLILSTNPDNLFFVFLFFVLSFGFFVFLFSLLLANTRRGIIAALAIVTFLVLRYFGVGNLLNGILIIGATIASEIYFWYSGDQT